MKKITFLLVSLFLASCSVREQIAAQTAFLSGHDRKQKQKVFVLQKKLEMSERTLAKSQDEVDLLLGHLCDAQLESIELQVEQLERRWQIDPISLSQTLYAETSRLFLDERETLYQILQRGICVHRAQNLIDRILQLITQVNDCAARTY
jgi:hypothetical protein